MSIDWFEVLELAPNASIQAVNAAWRRLVLLHHPDKARDVQTAGYRVAEIHLINEARTVLSDPARRAAYLESKDSSPPKQQVQEPSGPTIHQHISLADFTPHLAGETDIPEYYTHACRCSGTFMITHSQLEEGVEVVGCPGCGQWCRVGYEEFTGLEDEDDENGVDLDGRDSVNGAGSGP